MHPFYLCVSCHKQNFKNNLCKVESKKVQNIKLQHKEVFDEVVTAFMTDIYESPYEINTTRKWQEGGCEIIENVPSISEDDKRQNEKDKKRLYCLPEAILCCLLINGFNLILIYLSIDC